MLETSRSPATDIRERFAQLFRPCEGTLLGHARRLNGGDEDRAQDLTQEALVRAYDAFRRGLFREGAPPCAWLHRIATNHFINEYRRRRRWEAGTTVDALTRGGDTGPRGTHAADADRPDAALADAQLDEPLEQALRALSAPLRAAVILVDMEDRTYEEAAQALGVPVGTIRSRLSRARYLLQTALADYARERRLG